jgi:hypothetical protein
MIFVVHVSRFEEMKINYKILSENLKAECSRRLKEKY